MRYEHIIAEVMRHPWAISDAKFDAICMVLARCEAGERLTEEEIRERVGERKVKPVAFVLDDEGVEMTNFKRDARTYRGFVIDSKSGADTKSKGLTAIIPVWGILVNRVAALDISETGTGVDALQADFRKAMSMGDIKTIIFDFDSPGGSVYGIHEFAQEIFDARGKGKQIIAQIDPLCASAAYYLASQCDEIVMTPSGEVGSIGVRTMHQDLSKALEMKGIKITHISAGKFKTEGNPTEPLSEEGFAYQQQRVDDYYGAFVETVARGRGVSALEVKEGMGEGRVVGAADAKKLKMIDRIATLDETLQRIGAGGTKSSMATASVEGSSKTATAEIKTEVVMENANANAATEMADAVRAAAVAETERVDKITQLAEAHGLRPKLTGWLKDKKSVADVQTEILAGIQAQPVRQPSAEAGRIIVMRDEQDKKMAEGIVISRVVRAVAGAALARRNGNIMTPAQYATNVLKDAHTGGILAASNPQDASSFAGGGFMLGDNISDSVIELLRPASVVRRANPATAPLVNGVLTLPKLTGGATANWIGENKAIVPTKVSGGQVKAVAKKLAALVPLSNDLLRYSGGKADSIVRDDMIASMAQAEELGFLRGPGEAYTPKGMRNWVPGANVVHANQVVNLANVRQDIGKIRLKLRRANARFLRPVWFMAPGTEEFLLNLADANGNLVYYNEMVTQGTFRRYPYFVTTQIPENLNLLGGSNETELMLVDMADVVIADAPQIGVEVSSEAAYDDGAGNLTSAFSNDQTVIRVIEETDLIVRHPESLVVLDEVIWV
jgi:HK97 family phage major capsid protein